MKIFLAVPLLFLALVCFSCSNDSPVSPVTTAKFQWEQVDSISTGGYFAVPVAAAENNTYYYISDNYLVRCNPSGKTVIDIGFFGTSTIEAYNNNYVVIGGDSPASSNDSSISKVKILSDNVLTEIIIDTVRDIYPAVVFVMRPGKFYYASRYNYYLVEDGAITKFSLSGVNNITGFSKIGNTIFVLAYNLGNGQSIFRLQENSSPVLFENDVSFTQNFSTHNNLFKSRYVSGAGYLDYMTESGWVNFYSGSAQFFNHAAADDIYDLFMVSNSNGVFQGNIWNGTNFSDDENYPFKDHRWSSLYYGNMKDGIVYFATVYDKVRIYRGKRVL